MSVADQLERHQIACYLGGLVSGGAIGLALPASATAFELAIFPVLGALLYATFLQVPFTKLTGAFRDVRFLTATLTLNFVVVPLVVVAFLVVVALSPASPPTPVVLGVLLVLLTPCIDYVIVFSGLAGGDSERLLAAAPLLMLAQMLALPVLLLLFIGPSLASVIDIEPFLEAFLLLIVVPLLLAWLTEMLAERHRSGRAISSAMNTAMVPLMTATLLVVVASQVPRITDQLQRITAIVPLYAAFLVIMAVVGLGWARLFRLDVGRSRALIFAGATRNSLVVLPLALALPEAYAVTPVVVVTQTLVELLGMVGYVRVVPRLVPERT